MKEKQSRFRILLEKYYENSLSKEEYVEFVSYNEVEKVVNNTDISIKDDWSESHQILTKIKQTNVRRKRVFWVGGMTIAASVLLLVSFFMSNPEVLDLEIIHYSTNFGETKEIDLPDGSSVLLNANSSLTWDENWTQSGIRTVELKGEAFFDVKQRSDKMKFNVHMEGIDVHVIGTQFNVRNRSGQTDVFLESGKIDLSLLESQETVEMVPGDLVQFEKQTKKWQKQEAKHIDQTASWVNGMLFFENENSLMIFQRLEELYGLHFKIENKELLNKRMDLSLPYSNWDLIKQALEISLQVKFTESTDTIVVN